MKRTFEVTVRGREHVWGFHFRGDPKYLPDWLGDGLEVIDVLNTVPDWAVGLGLTRIWCRVQDAWYWLRVF